jgi:farnesyl-diphosphate farnesyltransferase
MADLEDLLLRTSRTFALSIPRLPEPTRSEVRIAYLLFRIADTFEDAAPWPRERRLQALEDLCRLLEEPDATDPAAARRSAESWTAGEPPSAHEGYMDLLAATPEVMAAFAALSSAARRQVAVHTARTARGMEDFVRRHDDRGVLRLGDLEELQRYCYVVAGIVGEMLTELFLLATPALSEAAGALRERAASFGEALQLVNILKDSADDEREGRSYLPTSVARERIFSLARRDLEVAGEYVARLQRGGAPRGVVAFTALPAELAWRTLDRVEEDGPGSKLRRVEVGAVVARVEARVALGRLPVRLPARS